MCIYICIYIYPNNIEYWSGEIITRYAECMQRIMLFKKVDNYGNDRVLVCSSAWYEMEHILKHREYEHDLMLSHGK